VPLNDETSNPFRFRGLPHPPQSLCLPVTFDPHHPKWPHSNCSTFQPMIRLGPAREYYPYAYSAVYETIDDDEDDDDDNNKNGGEGSENYPMIGHTSANESFARDLTASYQPMNNLPCGCSPFPNLSINHDCSGNQDFFQPLVSSPVCTDNEKTLDLRTGSTSRSVGHVIEQCSCDSDVVIRNRQAEAETEFNGDDIDKSCAPYGQKLTDFSCTVQRSNEVTDKTRVKQEIEKSSDYCSDVSCVSIGSASSSRNGAVGSPSSLSGYTNDFSFTSGIRRYDSSVASSQTGTNVSKHDPRSEQPATCARAENFNNPGKFIISSNSAFHPPDSTPQGNTSLHTKSIVVKNLGLNATGDVANKNSLLLKVQALGEDTRRNDTPCYPHSHISNDSFPLTSKDQTHCMSSTQSQPIACHQQQIDNSHQHHPQQQPNNLANHLLHYYQHRQCHHPHHHQHQHQSYTCHRQPPPQPAASSGPNTKRLNLNSPASGFPCGCERDNTESRKGAPCCVKSPDLGHQAPTLPYNVPRTIDSSIQYSNTDALLACSTHPATSNTQAPVPRPKTLNSTSRCESHTRQHQHKNTEFNDDNSFKSLQFIPPPSFSSKHQLPVNCETSTNDHMPKQKSSSSETDGGFRSSSLPASVSGKKAALALHSQYFEKTSPV
ncbi:hypothetical protein ElyMa_000952600, partial [Elysia marginata]